MALVDFRGRFILRPKTKHCFDWGRSAEKRSLDQRHSSRHAFKILRAPNRLVETGGISLSWVAWQWVSYCKSPVGELFWAFLSQVPSFDSSLELLCKPAAGSDVSLQSTTQDLCIWQSLRQVLDSSTPFGSSVSEILNFSRNLRILPQYSTTQHLITRPRSHNTKTYLQSTGHWSEKNIFFFVEIDCKLRVS